MKKTGLIFYIALLLVGCVSTPTVTEEKAPRVIEKKKSSVVENAPFAKQLTAMGYELSSLDGSARILAKSGEVKFVLQKTDSGYIVFRRFTAEKKLGAQERFEMLKIINKINSDHSYQVSYEHGDYIDVALYIIGSTDTASFAKVVRLIEGSGRLFQMQPRMIELLRE